MTFVRADGLDRTRDRSRALMMLPASPGNSSGTSKSPEPPDREAFALDDVRAAHEWLESGSASGKAVLVV